MPTTNSNYRIDWARLLPQLLPVLLRRGVRLRAWLGALLSPLTGELYTDFLALVAQARRELTYNGVTILLQSALNDYFDPTLRRVEIRNNDVEILPQYLFFEREGQALPPVFYRSELPNTTPLMLTYQTEQINNGFTVYAPTLQRFDKQIKAKTDRLKIAMTAYQVFYVAPPPR